jgi:hypothetical protein
MNMPHLSVSGAVVNRRRFLRGIGVGLALPALECMTPVFAKSVDAPPKRMLLISNNLGVLPKPFFPTTSGPGYTLSPYLKELAEHRQDFTVFSGLSHPNVIGGHMTDNCFLTAARDPTGSAFRNSISLDQYAFDHLGQQTRFPTLNLGVNIDRANRSLSWTRDGAIIPAEDSPAALFRRLFIMGSKTEIAQQQHRLQKQRSILDAVANDLQGFQRGLGHGDQQRLDQYFTSIRELETALQNADEWITRAKPAVDRELPVDIKGKAKFFPKIELMLEMIRLAFESDSTRIVTLMIDAFATPAFEISDEEKSSATYHHLTHHSEAKGKMAQLERIDFRQMRVLQKMLQAFSERSDGGPRLLDSTMVLFGSSMGDANVHNNTNLPILLAGGGFKHGQHLAFDQGNNAPLSNLFVSMLQNMGIETDQFGSSTGLIDMTSAAGRK